jgi:spoIIIJ-associated protein
VRGMDIKAIIEELLRSIGYQASVSTAEIGGQTVYSIEGVAEPRDLIGVHGDTIHAIDTLVKKIVEKGLGNGQEREMPLFLVDIDDYRARQIRDLQTKAKMMAERARSFQYDVELSPMTSYERLIVHTALQDEPNVVTESQGEGRNRRVVIKYSASR